MRRFIKKLSFAVLLLVTVTSMLLSLSSCAFLLPKVSDKLPDEEIIKVEAVTKNSYGNISYRELSEEKMVKFKEALQNLRYRRWYNLHGFLYRPIDNSWILITYQNYTVELGDVHMLIANGTDSEWITLVGIYPQDTFAEMFELFED